jgi:hypothetical protein
LQTHPADPGMGRVLRCMPRICAGRVARCGDTASPGIK